MKNKLEMSEYLLPSNENLSISGKRKMFEIRNRMTKIPCNFGNKEARCICGAEENMHHIYLCNSINKIKPEIPYNEIYNGNLKNQIYTFKRMENNLKIREKIKEQKEKHPCDPCDPLYCQYGIG